MNLYFLTAGAIMGAINLLHIFAGGPEIAHPVRRAPDLSPLLREVTYYCWHLVTISMGLIMLLFLWPAFDPSAWELAVLGTVAAGAFSLWGLVLARMVGQSYRDMPQGWLFLPVAVLGALGLS